MSRREPGQPYDTLFSDDSAPLPGHANSPNHPNSATRPSFLSASSAPSYVSESHGAVVPLVAKVAPVSRVQVSSFASPASLHAVHHVHSSPPLPSASNSIATPSAQRLFQPAGPQQDPLTSVDSPKMANDARTGHVISSDDSARRGPRPVVRPIPEDMNDWQDYASGTSREPYHNGVTVEMHRAHRVPSEENHRVSMPPSYQDATPQAHFAETNRANGHPLSDYFGEGFVRQERLPNHPGRGAPTLSREVDRESPMGMSASFGGAFHHSEPRPRSEKPQVWKLGPRCQGIVKYYDHEKRYGFLIAEQSMPDRRDIFVHGSAVNYAASAFPYQILAKGDLVEYNLLLTHKGYQATNVTLMQPAPTPPKSDALNTFLNATLAHSSLLSDPARSIAQHVHSPSTARALPSSRPSSHGPTMLDYAQMSGRLKADDVMALLDAPLRAPSVPLSAADARMPRPMVSEHGQSSPAFYGRDLSSRDGPSSLHLPPRSSAFHPSLLDQGRGSTHLVSASRAVARPEDAHFSSREVQPALYPSQRIVRDEEDEGTADSMLAFFQGLHLDDSRA